ncbi:MAG: type II secretion system protein [Planctomycetes bacterium]|nr:type II secretion system protein [Planctomycetota bacterium]
MSTNKRKAFTLIELLVVVSIIALLVSVLIPALSSAKQLATSTVCLTNQKGLVLAWRMYTDDNDDKLVNGYAHPDEWGNPSIPAAWVGPPMDEDGNVLSGDVTLAERLNGLREGALASYTGQAVELYHCPGDNRTILGTRHGPAPQYQIYRSYSVSRALSTRAQSQGGIKAIKQLGQVRMPSAAFVFVEEAYDGGPNPIVGAGNRNFNDAAWNFTGKACYCWWDPLAQFHHGATTFSFADGHAELRKWVEKRTVEFHKDRFGPLNTVHRREKIDNGQVGDSPDIDWTIRNLGAIYE